MRFAEVTDRYTAEEMAAFYETGQWQRETLWDVVERHARAHADRLFLTDNTTSLSSHAAWGFEVTERIVMLRKRL